MNLGLIIEECGYNPVNVLNVLQSLTPNETITKIKELTWYPILDTFIDSDIKFITDVLRNQSNRLYDYCGLCISKQHWSLFIGIYKRHLRNLKSYRMEGIKSTRLYWVLFITMILEDFIRQTYENHPIIETEEFRA